MKGDRALYYNGAETATRKHSNKSSAEMDGQREERIGEPADVQTEKRAKRCTYENNKYVSYHFIFLNYKKIIFVKKSQ